MTPEQEAEHALLSMKACDALAGGQPGLARQYKEQMQALRGVSQSDMDVQPIPVSGVCTPAQHKANAGRRTPGRGKAIAVRDVRSSDAIGREVADISVAMVGTSTDGRFVDLYRRHA